MNRWLGLAPLLWFLCACDVASVLEAPSTIARNHCQSSSDCGPSGICDSSQQCKSKTAALRHVLFEVTPPADSSAVAGVQFLIPKDLDDSEVPLELGQISQITGRVKSSSWSCKPRFGDAGNELALTSDSSMPALLSLIPVTDTLGLYSPRVLAQAVGNSAFTYFSYSANVSPGYYDIYVEPKHQPDESCPVPPQLLRGQKIAAGTLPLDIDLAEPSRFEFHVSWPPGDGALNGWMVDMLDPTSGRAISNRVQLGLANGNKTDYRATLAYSSVTVASASRPAEQDQLLRLSPPDGLPENEAAPTVLMARSALALFDSGTGTLADFTSQPNALPKPVHVVGQVTSNGSPTPVDATISLVATKITGINDGVLTSFTRTVKVGPDHTFEAYLLPGEYRVSTVPDAPLELKAGATPLAANVRPWTVPSSPPEQQGKVIELGYASLVSGLVVDVTGAFVSSAPVQATASQGSIAQQDFLRETLDGAAFVPRAAAAGVDGGGNFELRADPGTFDITVRPNDDTGFAWLVMPSAQVTPGEGASLGRQTMPLPVSYHGTVTTADGTELVPSSLVRAYVYLKDGKYTSNEDQSADSVLQIAETRVNKDGEYEILIPAALNPPPVPN